MGGATWILTVTGDRGFDKEVLGVSIGCLVVGVRECCVYRSGVCVHSARMSISIVLSLLCSFHDPWGPLRGWSKGILPSRDPPQPEPQLQLSVAVERGVPHGPRQCQRQRLTAHA